MRTTSRGSATAPGLGAQRTAVADQVGQLAGVLRELRCAGSGRLVRLGVSMTHLHVLAMLRHHGPLPMRRVAEHLDVSLSSATGIVDRLEERGYVERSRVDDDRRVVIVRPTAAALAVLDDMDLIHGDLVRAVLDRLDGDQLARLAATIGDLRAALDAELAADPRLAPHDRHAARADGPAA